MRKLFIIISISMMFTCFLNADDFLIGNGNANQNYVPFYGYNKYGWSKFFYTAAEMQAAGMSGTVQINKIAFNLIGGSWDAYMMGNQQIYFRYSYDESYASSATSYPGTASFTQVFNGTTTWSGPGWVFITLDTPYNHNTNWNLEILWENRYGNKTAGPPKFQSTDLDNSIYRAVYKYNDSSFPTTSGTRLSKRPNITFITPATDVPNPAVISSPLDGAINVDVDASLKWSTGGGDPADYLFSLWKLDPLVMHESNLLMLSTTYDPDFYLDYGTTYYWRVIPRNDFGSAVDCPTWSFTTLPDPSIMAFPWQESFDGSSFPPNADWQRKGGILQDPITLGGSSLWEQENWLNISGTDQAARLNIWGNLNGWLITPLFKIDDENMALSFDLALLKSGQPPTGIPPAMTGMDDRFAVLIGDGFTWSTANIVREWNNAGSEYVLNEISMWGERVEIPLSGHAGHIRIAFYAGSTESNADNDFMINNLAIGAPALPAPLVNISLNQDQDTCTLSWEPVSGATDYDVYHSTTPYGNWTFLANTDTASLEVDSTSAKAFFCVKAKKP